MNELIAIYSMIGVIVGSIITGVFQVVIKYRERDISREITLKSDSREITLKGHSLSESYELLKMLHMDQNPGMEELVPQCVEASEIDGI